MSGTINRVGTVIVLGIVLVASAAGFASAAIPDSTTKVYTACVSSDGSMRLINYENGKRCRDSEKTRTWNKVGPAGADGDDGLDGDTGDQGPAGVSGYEVVSQAFVMTVNVEYGT